MSLNTNLNISDESFTLSINKCLEDSKFGVLDEGTEIERSAFEFVKESLEKVRQSLEFQDPKSEDITNASTRLSSCLKGLEAIKSNVSKLSHEDLTQAYEGIETFDNYFKVISKKLNELATQFFSGDDQNNIKEQLQILIDQEKSFNRIKTQILCSKSIKEVHVKKIQASLKNTKTDYGYWILDMIFNFSVIRKLIQYFLSGKESISKESQLDQLFRNCEDSLLSLETANFYLDTAEEDIKTLEIFLNIAEVNLSKFLNELTDIQEKTNDQNSFQEKLIELQNELANLKKQLQEFREAGFTVSHYDKALMIFESTMKNRTVSTREVEKQAIAIITLFEEAIDREEQFNKEDGRQAILWAKQIVDDKLNNEKEAKKNNSSIMTEHEFTLFSLCSEGAQEIIQLLSTESSSPSKENEPLASEQSSSKPIKQEMRIPEIDKLLGSIKWYVENNSNSPDKVTIQVFQNCILEQMWQINDEDYPIQYGELETANKQLDALSNKIEYNM